MLEIALTDSVDNLCDYTFNFHWQNQELDPASKVPHQKNTEYTYRELVDELKRGGEVHIIGDVGKRFAYSMGVDLKHFGGSGTPERAGTLFVDGNIGAEAGMGIVSGLLYVSGEVEQPMGNIMEVESDIDGYRKFRSITDILCNGTGNDVILTNSFDEKEKRMVISDGILRGTLAARCSCQIEIIIEGDAYNGSGLLMQTGSLIIKGNAGMNTGAHLDGGTVVVRGTVGEFAGAYMKKGVLFFQDAKGYVGAQMEGGSIYSKKKVKASPPAGKSRMGRDDISLVRKYMDVGRVESMLYNRYEVEEEKEKYITVHMRDGSIVTRKVE